MTGQQQHPTRDEKVENLLTNYSLIFMSMFEQAFTGLATKMSEVVVKGGAVMADAMTASLAEAPEVREMKRKVDENFTKEIEPEVSKQVGRMFSDLRKELSSRFPKGNPEFAAFLANPAFDNGIAIAEKNDFNLPKLTEEMTDSDLAGYLRLLSSGNEELGKMFKALAEWQEDLPKPPSDMR